MAQAVESKVVILLSEISSNKICDAFLRKLAEQDDFSRLYENVIRLSIEETLKAPVIDFCGDTSSYSFEQETVNLANDTNALNLYG